MLRLGLSCCFWLSCISFVLAQEVPLNYALLIGVGKYDHAGISELKYPEADARAIGKLLTEAGYRVEYLLGNEATRKSILEKFATFNRQGNASGVVLVGIFGHGTEVPLRNDKNQIEYDTQGHAITEGCFQPFDTVIQQVKDEKGKLVLGNDLQPLVEPDSKSLIKLSDLMNALNNAKAGSRVVLADCCRTVPNQARGRSFGTSFKAKDLPQNTSVLFGCSPNEEALESDQWGHGAFTQCLLEELPKLAEQGEAETGILAARLKKSVPALVAKVEKRKTQTPVPFLTNTVDLQLSKLATSRPIIPEIVKLPSGTIPTHPATKGMGVPPGNLPLGKPGNITGVKPGNTTTHQSAIDNTVPVGINAGEQREFAGIKFRWCPPTGEQGFIMGTIGARDDERPVKVVLSKGFWICQTEVTQGHWKSVMGTEPWKENGKLKKHVKEGSDYPAVYVSHGLSQDNQVEKDSATEFVRTLSIKEGMQFRLPTEAEWEYACRAGTATKFSFGDDLSKLDDYAWQSRDDYAHHVGQKLANPWGLYDMHGNVQEWCSDWYRYALPGGSDPMGATTGEERVQRGGAWLNIFRHDLSSSARTYNKTTFREFNLGFRIVLVNSDTGELISSKPNPRLTSTNNDPSRKKAGEQAEFAGMKFRWCPPTGEHGYVKGTPGTTYEEKPVNVVLTRGFWMGETEVTQGQWKDVIGTEPWKKYDQLRPGYFREGLDYPVVWVSHGSDSDGNVEKDSVTEFVQVLSKKEGKQFRLPTEAEWEYACRAGTATKYSFGDDESKLDDYAWYRGNAYNLNEKYAHPVRQNLANPWGLYDMHGNVWEWCSDWGGKQLPGDRDPMGPITGERRVLRGGGFGSYAEECRSANKLTSGPTTRNYNLGFRIVLVP
jgi:formylglycine-generating enzyme required for sulfatase activity